MGPMTEYQHITGTETVLRDGTIKPPAIHKTSGNAFYDNAALRAVMGAGPFPKLPDDWTKPSLRILFTFDLRRG